MDREQLRKDAKKFREENPRVVDLQTEAKAGVTEEEVKKTIRKAYFEIIDLLKEYCELREEYYPIVALWILGTYFHKQFQTYPYLFFNAMKGSGKTRILKLISYLSYRGKMVVSLREATLFRTASNSTFCIDEFEDIRNKKSANSTLKELLNVAYKKGNLVQRERKVNSREGEGYVTEEFDLFCPISIANIGGMENVLGDRCLTLILEKSSNKLITRRIENFEDSEEIKEIIEYISRVSRFSLTKGNNLITKWNAYLDERENSTKPINNINSTNSTIYTDLFDKINNTSLIGRNLELFFPLYIIAYYCGNDIVNGLIKISEIIVREKKEDDAEDNTDISLIEFISLRKGFEYEKMRDLAREFKQHYGAEDGMTAWINERWLGRALKRLSLAKHKRTVGGRREVILDVPKAKKLLRMFQDEG